MNFENKTILVTGANRGIGRQIVTALLGKGVTKIYAGSRTPEALPDFKDMCNLKNSSCKFLCTYKKYFFW